MSMTREEALRVRPGDTLTIDPLWNQSTGSAKYRFPKRVEILGIYGSRNTETGVLFLVRDNSGQEKELSAGWFLSIEEDDHD